MKSTNWAHGVKGPRSILTKMLAFLLVITASNLILPSRAMADEGLVTRGEWVTRLVDTFEVTVEEEEYPDDYYTDIDPSSPYYIAVMRATDFGIVDLEAGQPFNPGDAVTREFAAKTLNFCLGFQLEEDVTYTYTDNTEVDEAVRADLQVAVNRGWFMLDSGLIRPAKFVTKAEADAMFADAEEVWHSTDDIGTKPDDIKFKSGVKVVPDGTPVAFNEDDTSVTIENCPVAIAQGDIFAVYYEGMPLAFKAQSVQSNGTSLAVAIEEIDPTEAYDEYNYSTVENVDLSEFTGDSGTKMQYAPPVVNSNSKLKGVSFKNGVLKFDGKYGPASINGQMTNVKTKEQMDPLKGSFVYSISGNINYTVSLSAKANASIPMGYVTDGLWRLELTAEYQVSGKISATSSIAFSVGAQYDPSNGYRTIKSFKKSKAGISAQAQGRTGLQLVAGCKVPKVLDLSLGLEGGVEANYMVNKWNDGKAPYVCQNAEAHLYAGVFFHAGFLKFPSYDKSWPIWDADNSPVRISKHCEDGATVASCTRGVDYSKYYVRYGNLSYGGADSSQGWRYGSNGELEPYAIYEYELDDANNATITKYHGNMRVLIIPDTIDGYTVTGIGSSAFASNAYLMSVQIPDTVTEIEDGAFRDCSNLSSVNLPTSLKTLGTMAFYDCDLITSVTVPASLEGCGGDGGCGPFGGCDGLKEVSFEAGTTRVADHLLYDCPGIESVAVPEGVTLVESYAFGDCVNLTSVSLPSTLTIVGYQSFNGCSKLAEVQIPDTVTEIEDGAFSESGLTSVVVPQCVTTLGSRIFRNCTQLVSAKLPDDITTLNENMFSGCTALENVTLPKSLTVVSSSAFKDCTSLKSIDIPTTVERIYSEAFRNCDSLTKVVIPNSVVYIGSQEFYDCDALTDVVLSTGIESIPSEAFRHCDSLEKIVLPYRVTKIESNAFVECTKLKSVTIPRATTTIADGIFSYPSKMTINGVAGTYAETYAKDNSIKFNPIDVSATSITIDQKEVTLLNGKSITLAADIQPIDFTGEVTWKSSNTSVAKVDAYGKITAVGVGKTTVKLVVGDKAASVTVNVVQGVTSIGLNKTSLSLDGADTFQLVATVYPSDAQKKDVEWSTDNAEIATVDSNGLVTALKKGTATITAKSTDGSNVSRTCKVTVANNAYIVDNPTKLESPHPYENSCTDIWSYRSAGSNGLVVTFDERSSVEEGCDYIKLFDSDGNLIGTYTGSELAGQSVSIPGDTIKIRLESDSALAEWGFKVTSIAEGERTRSIELAELTDPGYFDSLELTYTGEEQRPFAPISYSGEELIEGKDYEISYTDNVNAGTGSITYSGIGQYEGSKSFQFSIGQRSLDSTHESVAIDAQMFTGEEIRPDIESLAYGHTNEDGSFVSDATLVNGRDYELEYENAVHAGTAAVIATGIGNCFGSTRLEYKILPASINLVTIDDIEDQVLSGSEARPSISASYNGYDLAEGVDYDLSYTDNTEPGVGTVLVEGRGDFEGDRELQFAITSPDPEKVLITDATIEVDDQTYDGTQKEPEVIITINGATLVAESDYTVVYRDNINAGTAMVEVTGAGRYEGVAKASFLIAPADINAANISAIPDQEYTGEAIEPVVTVTMGDVTLKSGTDYTLEFADNVDVGVASVTASGRGNYVGSKKTTFKIVDSSAPTSAEWKRLAGNGRYDTMAAIVSEGWSGQTGGTVVVATGEGFKDALAAAGLAGLDGGPVVLTAGKSLSRQAEAQLKALKPSKVYVAGGKAAVSDGVLTAIQRVTGVRPERVFGQTSASTSAALAKAGGSRWDGTAIIATNKSFKDALSVAPISYAKHWPILLADNGKSLNADVVKALKDCGIRRAYIVGGKPSSRRPASRSQAAWQATTAPPRAAPSPTSRSRTVSPSRTWPSPRARTSRTPSRAPPSAGRTAPSCCSATTRHRPTSPSPPTMRPRLRQATSSAASWPSARPSSIACRGNSYGVGLGNGTDPISTLKVIGLGVIVRNSARAESRSPRRLPAGPFIWLSRSRELK